MTDNPVLLSIRTKKLGVLLRDARLHCQKSIEDCARALGVLPETIEQYERGQQAPSLPEVEILAHYLNIPLEHFWGQHTLGQDGAGSRPYDPQQLLRLRQRMVGLQLRQARLDADLSLEELAQKVGISPETLSSYEVGRLPVPLPDLEVLSQRLNRSPRDFQDRSGPVGAWMTQQAALRGIQEMPPEMQAFVSKPINRPYIELAQRLSEMSVERLRLVAEGLLEITL